MTQPDTPELLPEQERQIVDELFDVFKGAREIAGPLPPGRVLEHIEGKGIIVELVAVSDEGYETAKARGAYDDAA